MSTLLELARRFWNQLTTQGLRMTAWAGVDWIHRAVTGRPVRRFSEITPELFVGGQPSNAFLKTLVNDWQVTGIINMRGEFDYELKVEGAGLRYLYLPTVDNNAPTLKHLQQGVDFIREEVLNGGAVYIHCWEGLGRGPTMVAAYLVSRDMSPDEAWETIRIVRPFIRPTEKQIEQLKQFADAYQPHGSSDPVTVVAPEPEAPPLSQQ